MEVDSRWTKASQLGESIVVGGRGCWKEGGYRSKARKERRSGQKVIYDIGSKVQGSVAGGFGFGGGVVG